MIDYEKMMTSLQQRMGQQQTYEGVQDPNSQTWQQHFGDPNRRTFIDAGGKTGYGLNMAEDESKKKPEDDHYQRFLSNQSDMNNQWNTTMNNNFQNMMQVMQTGQTDYQKTLQSILDNLLKKK
jgi:hypothetical protein